jgi:NitT/TauT family transport system substrate-binding protein
MQRRRFSRSCGRLLRHCIAGASAVLIAAAALSPVLAQEKLKLASGQRGNWDTSVSEVGKRAGIFKKHGLDLDILYTEGGGETLQATISGSVDIGIAAGVMGVLGAYSKGAPVRIIGAEATGANDLFWYVRSDSPIRTLKDTNGKTIAFSTTGSSTNGVVRALIDQYGLTARPTATGGPAATLTQVMSRQIDVGWSAPPFGLPQLDRKQIRIIARGDAANVFRDQTVRVNVTHARLLRSRPDTIRRFAAAYRETVDWMYSDPRALKIFAEFSNVPEATARRTKEEFFPKAALSPDRIVGLEPVMRDAVRLKYISAPLTAKQLAELVQIPPRGK